MDKVISDAFSVTKLFPRYLVSTTGVITDKADDSIVTPTRDDNGVLVAHLQNLYWRTQTITVAELVTLAFGPICPDWKRPFLKIIHCDGNLDNNYIGNLNWEFSDYVPQAIPGVNCPLDTLVTIPEFSRYRISIHARVYSWDVNKAAYEELGGGYLDRGYLRIRLVGDDGVSRIIAIHRLMALTFLKHPMDTSGLMVNHKNGIKLDLDLDNLEWVTPGENVRHAVRMGLIARRVPVLVMELKTGVVTKYITSDDAAQALGVPSSTIRRWCATWEAIKHHDGMCVKYVDDPRPWPELGDPDAATKIDGKPILAKDVETGEVLRFRNIQKLAHHLQCHSLALYRYAKRRPMVPYKGYLIQYENPLEVAKWPTYTKDQLEIYALGNNNRTAKVVSAKNLKTGEIALYKSLAAFSRASGLSLNHARAAIRRPNGARGYKLTELIPDGMVRDEAVGPHAIAGECVLS